MDCDFNDVRLDKYRKSIWIEPENATKMELQRAPNELFPIYQIKTWNKLCLLFWGKRI